MTYVLYEAPTRDNNYVEARTFAYLAEVDILGWKFRKMADGGFVIDTPRGGDLMGSNLVAVLGPEHVALITALMALETIEPAEVPDSWGNVGRVEGT